MCICVFKDVHSSISFLLLFHSLIHHSSRLYPHVKSVLHPHPSSLFNLASVLHSHPSILRCLTFFYAFSLHLGLQTFGELPI